MGTAIDGKAIADRINSETAKRVAFLETRGTKIKLAVLLVGDHQPSATYVRKKGEAAKKIGIRFALHRLPAATRTNAILRRLDAIQADPSLSGLIVQLPLPPRCDTPTVLARIRPDIDVDCLTPENLGRLIGGDGAIVPPTPGAIMAILKNLHYSLAGKRVTIVGTGMLVGRPLAIMMINAGATVTTCNSKTRNLADTCRNAEILVSCVGKKQLITKDMIKKDAVVIDAGVSFQGSKMFGDVDMEGALIRASRVTPTPGGVGPLTVALLLQNTVICAEHTLATL